MVNMNIDYQKWPKPGVSVPSVSKPNPWLVVFQLLFRRIWAKLITLFVCALLGAVALGALSRLSPPTYKATGEIFVDPRGFGVDSNVVLDANAAINFVESKMLMISSDNVLVQVLRSEPDDETDAEAKEGFARQVINAAKSWLSLEATEELDPTDDEFTRKLELLRRALKVQRIGRSFVVNVTVEDKSPDKAAERANKIMAAFLVEAAENREAIKQSALQSVAWRRLSTAEAEYLELAESLGEAHPRAQQASQKVEGLRRRLEDRASQLASASKQARPQLDLNNANAGRFLETAFLRVISPARTPLPENPLKRLAIWSVVGFVVGMFLTLAFIIAFSIRGAVAIVSNDDAEPQTANGPANSRSSKE